MKTKFFLFIFNMSLFMMEKPYNYYNNDNNSINEKNTSNNYSDEKRSCQKFIDDILKKNKETKKPQINNNEYFFRLEDLN